MAEGVSLTNSELGSSDTNVRRYHMIPAGPVGSDEPGQIGRSCRPELGFALTGAVYGTGSDKWEVACFR